MSYAVIRSSLAPSLALILAACAAPSADEASATHVDHLSTSECAAAAEWAPNTAYATGDIVRYGGVVYKVIQGHTSLSNWTPDIVPALFTPTDCAPGGGSAGGSTGGDPGGATTGSDPGHAGGSAGNSGNGGDPGNTGGTDHGGSNGGNTGGNAGGPKGSLAAHVLTGYWQNFNNGAKTLRLGEVPASYGLIAVAFADADPSRPGAVTFTLDSGLSAATGGYTEAQFISDIQMIHAQGRKVIISVGGQNGTISVADGNSASNFSDSVFTLMQKYGFDGVDIDLENGINPQMMGQALHQLASKAGSDLVITLAPQTIDMQSTQSGYFQLALGIKDILTIVNMQYYNSGSMLGADQKVYSQGGVDFLTALAAIQLEGGLRPDQVGLGLPASTSAAGSGYVSPSVVNAALDCLSHGTSCGAFKPSKTYSGLRGAMTWSISWDATNGFGFANTVTPHLNSL